MKLSIASAIVSIALSFFSSTAPAPSPARANARSVHTVGLVAEAPVTAPTVAHPKNPPARRAVAYRCSTQFVLGGTVTTCVGQ